MFPEVGESETILVDILKFFPTFSFLMSLWAFLIFPNQQKSPKQVQEEYSQCCKMHFCKFKMLRIGFIIMFTTSSCPLMFLLRINA